MEDPEVKTILDQDIAAGKELNVQGTPTFFVNGKVVEEFGPDPLKAAIDEAIKESEAL